MTQEPELPLRRDPRLPLVIPFPHSDRVIIEKLNAITGLPWKATPKEIKTLVGPKKVVEFEVFFDMRQEAFDLEKALSSLGLQPKAEARNNLAGVSLTRENASKILSDRTLQRDIHSQLKAEGFAVGAFIG